MLQKSQKKQQGNKKATEIEKIATVSQKSLQENVSFPGIA